MTKQIQSIVVAGCVARLLPLGMVLLIGMQTAQAKQCSAAVPSDPQGHWSYRFIDGRNAGTKAKTNTFRAELRDLTARVAQLGENLVGVLA
jgi:hypothetical protein